MEELVPPIPAPHARKSEETATTPAENRERFTPLCIHVYMQASSHTDTGATCTTHADKGCRQRQTTSTSAGGAAGENEDEGSAAEANDATEDED